MVTAMVFIDVEKRRVHEVGEALVNLPDMLEVYSATREHDLVTIVRVKEYDELGELVPERIARLPGILRTHTIMAFRCYSRRLMERVWSLGMEEEEK